MAETKWPWSWVVVGSDHNGIVRLTSPGHLERSELAALGQAVQWGEDLAPLIARMTEAHQKHCIEDAARAGLLRVRVYKVADLPDLDLIERWVDDGTTITVKPI